MTMNYEEDEILRISHLKFIGKALSVFTHELNNHLAVLKESAGLLEDTLRFQQAGTGYDLDGSLNIIQSIENQIFKATRLCKNFNGFGHRMDNPLSAFSVNEALEELLALLIRPASQKKVGFEKDFQKDIPLAYNDPSRLQFLIFCLIEESLKSIENGSIILKTEYSGGLITIRISREGDFTETEKKDICSHNIAGRVAEQLGGSIYEETEGEGVNIMLPLSVTGEASNPELY